MSAYSVRGAGASEVTAWRPPYPSSVAWNRVLSVRPERVPLHLSVPAPFPRTSSGDGVWTRVFTGVITATEASRVGPLPIGPVAL